MLNNLPSVYFSVFLGFVPILYAPQTHPLQRRVSEITLSRTVSSLFLSFSKQKKVSSSFFQKHCHSLCLLKSYPSIEVQFKFLFLHGAFFSFPWLEVIPLSSDHLISFFKFAFYCIVKELIAYLLHYLLENKLSLLWFNFYRVYVLHMET